MGQQLDPPMRVVYLIRNPLDCKASNIRHEMHRKGETLPAHVPSATTNAFDATRRVRK